MSTMPKYFRYFPGNYRWSSAYVNMLGRGSFGGSDISELHKIGRQVRWLPQREAVRGHMVHGIGRCQLRQWQQQVALRHRPAHHRQIADHQRAAERASRRCAGNRLRADAARVTHRHRQPAAAGTFRSGRISHALRLVPKVCGR